MNRGDLADLTAFVSVVDGRVMVNDPVTRPHRHDPHGARRSIGQTFTPEPLHEELIGSKLRRF
jgi:hypothetical protein